MPIGIDGTGTITGISAGGLPDATITTAEIVDANVTPGKLSQPLTLMTAKAYNWNGSSTNTSIDFTDIPSWAKRITVFFNGASFSSTAQLQVQLGTSGGFQTTSYTTNGSSITAAAAASATYTSGFVFGASAYAASGASINHGGCSLLLMDASTGTWVAYGQIGNSAAAQMYFTSGSKVLSGTLDRVRITSTSTDTFDAGTINVMYEG